MPPPDNQIISEHDLLAGCLKGDARMQEALYRKFSAKMYAVCLRYAAKSEDASDILQDGFVKVFRNLDKYRSEGSFEGWMRRIFVNTAIEHFRKQHTVMSATEQQEAMLTDGQWNAFDHLAAKDIMNLVRTLAPGYRQVFNLYAVEGYSHREIAAMLGISEGTSKSQLARAKAILQEKIRETQR
jgi:RNA polymerase sigma factor (sigma-70 family)